MKLNLKRTTAPRGYRPPAKMKAVGALPDEISWRSKVFDYIGRRLFGSPEALGVRESFYYVAAERPQFQIRKELRDNVRDQHIRRDIRVWLSRRMLIVGVVVVAVSVALSDGYTQALATATQQIIH